jgi:aurora kinase, other
MVTKQGHNGKVDIWALGMLVYELMVGKVPFSVWSEFDLHKIVEEKVVMPDYVDVSPALCDFVQLCLAKEHEQRATMIQLLNHEFLKEDEVKKQIKWELYSQFQAIL